MKKIRTNKTSYTVKELMDELAKYPEDALVAVHSLVSEDQGLLQTVKEYIIGKDELPYDKGDDITSNSIVQNGTHVVFLTYTGYYTG